VRSEGSIGQIDLHPRIAAHQRNRRIERKRIGLMAARPVFLQTSHWFDEDIDCRGAAFVDNQGIDFQTCNRSDAGRTDF
jgi:hypothetical protein